MYGPKPRGFWSTNSAAKYKHLISGHSYEVIQEFTDYDQFTHRVGEQWTFLGYSYLPYDDGLSLFVSMDGSNEWHIRMQCVPEQQGTIVDHLEMFVRDIGEENKQG